MKYLKQFCFWALILSLSYCASAVLTVANNPKFIAKKYKKILIVADFADLSIQRKIEYAILKEFDWERKPGLFSKGLDIEMFASFDLMPPYREYDSKEVAEMFDASGIDAILLIALEDFWNSYVYIPKTTQAQSWGYYYDNYISTQTRVQEYGGYNIEISNAKFKVGLIDKSGEIAWLAQANTTTGRFGTIRE